MQDPSLLFRAPTMDDARCVYELIRRCDIADYGEPDTELADVVFDWQHADLSRDAWLAWTPAGDLAGYALVQDGHAGLQYEFYVDPSQPDSDLSRALLARCELRGAAIAHEHKSTLAARIYASDANHHKCQIIEDAGFTIARYHWQMEISLDPPPPAPEWPAGISLRTAIPEQDDRAIHTLIEAAFSRPDRTPTTLEEWQDLMKRADILEPELWFLAMHQNQIVGVCLSFAFSTLGWVRQLAVAEAWRRQGIATALLRHAFAVFRERGYDRAGLAVAAENERAYSFYQQVGMHRIRQYNEYHKKVFSS